MHPYRGGKSGLTPGIAQSLVGVLLVGETGIFQGTMIPRKVELARKGHNQAGCDEEGIYSIESDES